MRIKMRVRRHKRLKPKPPLGHRAQRKTPIVVAATATVRRQLSSRSGERRFMARPRAAGATSSKWLDWLKYKTAKSKAAKRKVGTHE